MERANSLRPRARSRVMRPIAPMKRILIDVRLQPTRSDPSTLAVERLYDSTQGSASTSVSRQQYVSWPPLYV